MGWLDNMYRRLREFTTNIRTNKIISVYARAEYMNNLKIPSGQ